MKLEIHCQRILPFVEIFTDEFTVGPRMPDNHYLQDSSSQPAPAQRVHEPVSGQPAIQRLERLEQLLICFCRIQLRGATRPNSFLLLTDVTKDGPVACPFT